MRKIQYRFGDKGDIDHLIQLAIDLATEISPALGFTIDTTGIEDFINQIIDDQTIRPLLAYDKEQLVGALVLYRRKIFYMKESILMDYGLYVKKEYRNKGLKDKNIGYKLTRWAIDTARQNGITYLPSNMSGNPICDSLYFGMGFKYLGGFWMIK